jgi:uncharacterized OB-fold protein
MSHSKNKIPVEEDLWEAPATPRKKPQLIGSRCTSCGEIYFPKKKKDLCIQCQKRSLENIRFGGTGKIISFTVVERAPAGGFYKGPVPYAYGIVNLKDKVQLRSLFAGDLDMLKVGMDVELVIEKLFDDDEGNELVAYKFRPIKK